MSLGRSITKLLQRLKSPTFRTSEISGRMLEFSKPTIGAASISSPILPNSNSLFSLIPIIILFILFFFSIFQLP